MKVSESMICLYITECNVYVRKFDMFISYSNAVMQISENILCFYLTGCNIDIIQYVILISYSK